MNFSFEILRADCSKASYCSYARSAQFFDIGYCTVINYDAEGVSLVDQ